MISHRSGVLSTAAFLSMAVSAMAAEQFAKGMPVARELSGSDGHRFVFTVTPPQERGVDPRVFDYFEVSSRSHKPVRLDPTRKVEGQVEDLGEPVDVSGYRIKVEAVTLASCDDDLPIVKFKKVSLGGHKDVHVDVVGAVAMFASAYPTKGDVDAAITVGAAEQVCGLSINPAGQYDIVDCVESSCNPSNEFLTGGILNPFSSQATWVGAVTAVFAR
jgi:hypothetical protein